jgi:cephalosporin hydroxylase
MQHVLRELRMYSPMISRGSYLVVEDTHMDGVPTHPEEGPGPLAATLEFLKDGGDKEFEPDFSREKMVMTFNPGGWLRRK